MKTLLLLRHAKSSRKDDELDDHDRPLSKRGKGEAPRMGQLLKEEGLVPDLILASTARRARRTAEYVIQHSGYRGETRFVGQLYNASCDELLSFVADLPDSAGRVLLIGHNPGFEELLEALTGASQALTPAALAQLESPADSWRQFREPGQVRLVQAWQPRELD